jgi:hypothetical protein
LREVQALNGAPMQGKILLKLSVMGLSQPYGAASLMPGGGSIDSQHSRIALNPNLRLR